MLKLEVQVKFAGVLAKLKEKTATASDIGDLVQLVRDNKQEIPNEIKTQILSIPALVLKEKCKLKCNLKDWSNEEGSYFAGNCANLESWQNKFESKDFELEDMSNFMEYILADTGRLNSDFYLRNPEVTLKNDVCLNEESWYKDEQIIYAIVLENALMK